MPSTDDENLHPPPASTINTARERQPGTPSTLGDGSFRDSPTRAACAARAAAAAASRLQASALPHDSSSEEEEVEEETVEDIVLEQVGVVPVPVAESTSASATRTTTKRLYDTSVRDQVRTYYDIAPGTGSYQLGATFICRFCKKKNFERTTQFNVTLAKQHLINTCDSVPPDVLTWVSENSSNSNGFYHTQRKKGKRAAPGQQATGGGGSVASSSQQGSIRQFTRPNHIKSTLSPTQGQAVIQANIEMFLSFFDSPTRVNSPACVHAMITASGTGLQKFIPSDLQVWSIVKSIDEEAQEYMETRLKMEPGNLTIGFDGVTALGKHATLYTLSKGSISLFLTIR